MGSKQCNHFYASRRHTYQQRDFFPSDIPHFVISDRIIIGVYAFSFQPKSPLLSYETVFRVRNIGTQHANIFLESDTRHFTWFLNVLRAFLAGSELLWALFYY